MVLLVHGLPGIHRLSGRRRLLMMLDLLTNLPRLLELLQLLLRLNWLLLGLGLRGLLYLSPVLLLRLS